MSIWQKPTKLASSHMTVDLAGSRCSSRLSRQAWRGGVVGCSFLSSLFVFPQTDWNNCLHSQPATN